MHFEHLVAVDALAADPEHAAPSKFRVRWVPRTSVEFVTESEPFVTYANVPALAHPVVHLPPDRGMAWFPPPLRRGRPLSAKRTVAIGSDGPIGIERARTALGCPCGRGAQIVHLGRRAPEEAVSISNRKAVVLRAPGPVLSVTLRDEARGPG